MMRMGAWNVAPIVALMVLWQECGENLGIFCYRIGLSFFSRAQSRGLVPVRVREKVRIACSNRSEISSMRSMMWKA